MKRGWLTYAGILVCVAWLTVTLVLKYEPAEVAFATAQVQDNNVLSEATDTGPRFLYETVFALDDGAVFKLQSPIAPPAVEGPVCAQLSTGSLTGTVRYALANASNCP